MIKWISFLPPPPSNWIENVLPIIFVFVENFIFISQMTYRINRKIPQRRRLSFLTNIKNWVSSSSATILILKTKTGSWYFFFENLKYASGKTAIWILIFNKREIWYPECMLCCANVSFLWNSLVQILKNIFLHKICMYDVFPELNYS